MLLSRSDVCIFLGEGLLGPIRSTKIYHLFYEHIKGIDGTLIRIRTEQHSANVYVHIYPNILQINLVYIVGNVCI